MNEKVKDFFTMPSNGNLVEKFKTNIEQAIDSKLKELKPEDVKKIIEKMIRIYLGWLVVWGGIFGGVFGLIFYLTGDY